MFFSRVVSWSRMTHANTYVIFSARVEEFRSFRMNLRCREHDAMIAAQLEKETRRLLHFLRKTNIVT